MNENEIVSDQAMRAKKSGWDEAEKFYKAQFQEKVQEIFEGIETTEGKHAVNQGLPQGGIFIEGGEWQTFKEKTLKEV